MIRPISVFPLFVGNQGFRLEDYMATFSQQDDNGTVDGANAYIDDSFFTSYHSSRGSDTSSYTTAEIQEAIVVATDYLDIRFRYVGERVRVAQRTAWPRYDAEDADENIRFGIPTEVQEATAEYTLIALENSLILVENPDRDSTGRAISSKSETVGPISESVTYAMEGAVFSMPEYPKSDKKLITSGLVTGQRRVRRA